jgi:peptidoglycan/xylan/chitin deacetylase (PgdA/CDA1 family)
MQWVSRALPFAVFALLVQAPSAAFAATPGCSNPNALGVSRTVEIDTTGGPGFGMQHYKAYDFLQPKEVVLTFDDGPQKFTTEMVLKALADECTKAAFFSIGKMALGYPEIIREVAKAGHTIGTHTWSHLSMRKAKSFEEGKDEIERGLSAVNRALGGQGLSPFFRFPALEDTPETIAYVSKRNMAMFSTDFDSLDYKPQPAEHLIKSVMAKLEKAGKGIILMHDIHKTTAKAVPGLLAELKAKGFKIVHLKAKGAVQTLAEYDAMVDKDAKGLPAAGAERPQNSVIRTIEGDAPAEEKPAATPAAAPAKAAAQPPAAPAVTAPAAQPAPAAPAAPAATPHKASDATPEKFSADKQAADKPPVPTNVAVTVPAAGDAPQAKPDAVKTMSADDAAAPPKPATQAAAPTAAPATTATLPPKKSLTEKAKDIWEMWFGK